MVANLPVTESERNKSINNTCLTVKSTSDSTFLALSEPLTNIGLRMWKRDVKTTFKTITGSRMISQ